MVYNKDYIKGLIIEKIAGVISEGDNYILEGAIKENADIKIMWEEMYQTLTSAKATVFFNNLDENTALDSVEDKIINLKPRNHKFTFIIRWVSVAALLCIVLSIAYYLKKDAAQENAIVNTKAKTKPAVELLLASGQRINLSDTSKRVINIPSAQIKKGAKGLSYAINNGGNAAEWSTLNVPLKLDYQIVLSDGTKIWLNAASSIRFPFAFEGPTREVYLTGEAYFEVAKNPARPFIVHTSQTDVKVFGTAFNINAYDVSTITTSLVEGSVSTTGHNNESIFLKPGYQAIYKTGAGYTTKDFDAGIELAWMHGTYYFHNTRLGDISQVILRWFDIKVVFDNPQEAEESFTGAIEKNKPIGAFLQNLKTSADIETSLDNGILHIK